MLGVLCEGFTEEAILELHLGAAREPSVQSREHTTALPARTKTRRPAAAPHVRAMPSGCPLCHAEYASSVKDESEGHTVTYFILRHLDSPYKK